jgi:C4-type Zn-finger protein
MTEHRIPDDAYCPRCGSLLRIEQTIEGADADGNRGVRVTWKTCRECDYEENDCPFYC